MPELAKRSEISSLAFHLDYQGLNRGVEYWNPNSIFNWPESTEWYTRPQRSDTKARNICRIFDVSLAFTTEQAPFDLQKVIHWAFGPTGFTKLELLLLIVPGRTVYDECQRSAFCRNENVCPWEVLDHNGEVCHDVYPSVYPTFRSLRSSDYFLADRVDDITYSMPRYRTRVDSEPGYT